MKKILLLTNIYPSPDMENGDTPVVHYFTREWIKMGYDVRVIHYPANFPRLIMKICTLFKKQLSSRLGATIRTTLATEKVYELEGVTIKRIPLTKYRLHARYSLKQINKAFLKTIEYLKHDRFRPDLIISHWVNPQLEIMLKLKKKFDVPTCYVAHIPYLEFTRMYDDSFSQLLIDNIDVIGFRSAYIKDSFLGKFSFDGPTFQCYSGIPESFIPEKPKDRVFENITNFIFVGTLIKRKFPSEIIPALKKVYGDKKFNISYIGKGAQAAAIRSVAKKLDVENNVHMLGYLKREEVVKELQKSDVFVMISKSEAFGLVYLEAMAQGCITIASKHEGFDGIIKHGFNGFLCEAGNYVELADLLASIIKMKPAEIRQISENAIQTSKELTDIKAARLYINNVISLTRQKESISL